MIDTIKLGIPITKNQHQKLERMTANEDKWQWVMLNPKAGELRFLRHKGLVEVNHASFKREVFWDIPEFYRDGDTYLMFEFSIPKYKYGHNIHLLYGYIDVLKEFKKTIQKQLHLRLPDIHDWELWRVDICYAWRCPSQRIAEAILDSIKKLHFPRKRPHIYGDSIMFAGTTYSLKFYLKLPEFLAHDCKALLKGNARLEWINYLEKKADGVLRCEATLRRKYLQRNNIKTVADLTSRETYFINNEELKENYPGIDESPWLNTFVTMCILKYMDSSVDIYIEGQKLKLQGDLVMKMMKETYEFYAPECEIFFLGKKNYFKGGGFNTIVKEKTVYILQNIITKLIGEHTGMETIDQVREKLLKIYKQTKASRLVGFWLYVQRLGIEQAKKDFGRDSFYDAKKALKNAGVSLIEPVKVIDGRDRFIKEFKIELPSSHVTNKFDDYSDHDNLLNLPEQSSG